jgi:WD40 repeat protein
MIKIMLALAAGALIFVAVGIGTGVLEPPWVSKAPIVPAPPVTEMDLGTEFLYSVAPFPEIDKRAAKPRNEPIILSGFTNIKDKQEVPSQVSGQVLFIGEEIPQGIVEAVGIAPFMVEPFGFNVVTVGDAKYYKFYRQILPGQMVRSEQILGMIDCSKAMATMQEKRDKIQYAYDDEKAAKAAAAEAKARATRDQAAYDKGALSAAELSASIAAREKFHYDFLVKGSAIKVARSDLDQAKIFFHQHEIRNKIPFERSVVQFIYKQRGDAVKEGETVMVLHSLDHLLAEAQVAGSYLDRIKPEMTATLEPTQEVPPHIFRGAHRGEVTAVAVTNDADAPRVVSAGLDKIVSVRDPYREGLPIALRHDAPVRAMVCAPAKAAHNFCLAGAGDRIYVWDLARKALEENGNAGKYEAVKKIDDSHPSGNGAQGSHVTCLAYSPDGTYFASGADDGSIALWKTDGFSLVYRFDAEHGVEHPHADPITALSFTPQCRLVSASRDKTVRVWQLREKGALLDGEPIANRGGTVQQLGVSGDGKWLTVDLGRNLQLISMERPGVTATLENHGTSTPFETLALFSPDGSLMLTAGLAEGRLQLWKAPTEISRGFELRQFVPKEKRPATCAAFAPKRNVAVSGSTDGDIYLWELPTPEQIATHRIKNVPVRLLSPGLDPNTHQARIAVDVPNPASPQFPNGRLIPGRAVTIVIGEE